MDHYIWNHSFHYFWYVVEQSLTLKAVFILQQNVDGDLEQGHGDFSGRHMSKKGDVFRATEAWGSRLSIV